MISKKVTIRLLKDALSPYTVIAAFSIGIIFFAWLVTTILMPKYILWSTILLILIGFAIIFIYLRATRKLRIDIKMNSVEMKPIEYSEVFNRVDYVAGSAALYTPILGRLFPKLWGPKMTEVNNAYARGIDGTTYKIIPEADKGDKLYELGGYHSHVHLGYILV